MRDERCQPVLVDARQEDAYDRLRALQPRLILVEDNDTEAGFALTLGQILSQSPEIGVIRLNIQSNQLGIYSAKRVTASGIPDLVAAVRLLGEPTGPGGERPEALELVEKRVDEV